MNVEADKYDADKPDFSLIPANPLTALAEVYTYGAQKYSAHNWRKGMKWSRVFAAIMRHLWRFWLGADCDPESGLSHLAHAAWGCFTLLEYASRRVEFDDRFCYTYNDPPDDDSPDEDFPEDVYP